MTDTLKNKNCLITGATGALGSALAYRLANKGCNLLLTGRDIEKLRSLTKKIDKIPNRHTTCWTSADLTSPSSTEILIKYADTIFDVDILINSAGMFAIKDISAVSNVDLQTHIQLNVTSPYMLCQHFADGMKKKKWGRIVNIGSSSSYVGFKGGSLYCMTKHAILGMTRALYEELKEYNIQVVCVSPGSMQSEMAKVSVDQDFETFLQPEDVAGQIVNVLCMGNNMVCKEIRLDRIVIR